MNENLSVRMEKLETKVEAIGHDMTEVKNGVKQLTDALSGDPMRPGVLHSLNQRIEANHNAISDIRALHAKDLHEVQRTIQAFQSALIPQDEVKKIRQVVSWFDGWKLVIGSLIILIPIALTIYNTFKP